MKKILLSTMLLSISMAFAQEKDKQGGELQDVQIVGSRSSKRTVVNSAVPIDVINVKDVTTQSGKVEINELLQYVAPSFNANKQSGSDGADHVDPATLRGMGPDQTLVLINGKRYHQSSLVNLFGTRGRGNTGTDLNSIPATAIKRIEILRDGAAAQYGSDAIAGVINIVLNDNVGEVNGMISYGAYDTHAKGDFDPGTANTPGFRLDQNGNGNSYGANRKFDGNSLKAAVNYGAKVGDKGGFVNVTTEYFSKEKTLRPGFDFRKGFGEAEIKSLNVMANFMMPVTDNIEFYAYAGRNMRNTDAYAYTRNSGTDAQPRIVESITPGGFTPRIASKITDNTLTGGFRMKTANGWKIDLSNAFGNNIFDYTTKNTVNASLQGNSPREFSAGGFSLSQNTTNLDFTRNFKVLEGLNFAFGAEYRMEQYKINAGETGSWATYDTTGNVITNPLTQSAFMVPNPNYDPTKPISPDNPLLVPRPGGSQGFPGFSPKNELDKGRSSTAVYADAELDVNKDFMISTAIRYENYSDFGKTLNFKLAYRLKMDENFGLRGSFGSGFRAPSLAQLYFNTSFTNFTAAGASEVLLSANDSAVTKSFGIQNLKQETSYNGSIGFTANFKNFTATIDGYLVNVKDRIVLTGLFDASTLGLGVNQAQFFTNGVNTTTTGLDVVMSWKKSLGENSKFGINFVGNINKMAVTAVKNNGLDQETFFGAREVAFLKASAPNSKWGLNFNYNINKFDTGLAFTRFSEVILLDAQMTDDLANYGNSTANRMNTATNVYGAKIVTDLTFGYKITKEFKLSLGANNLLNVYPDQQNTGWSESGGYWDAVQMGFSGAYYYARLGFKF